MHESNYIKRWSNTRSLVALSSAGSEQYGVVNATSEALWFRSVLRGLGKDFANRLYSDAGAVLSIIQRHGLGKLRHVDCKYLFVQRLNAHKALKFSNVPGKDNPTDQGAKGFAWQAMLKHVSVAHGVFADRRPELCPRVS